MLLNLIPIQLTKSRLGPKRTGVIQRNTVFQIPLLSGRLQSRDVFCGFRLGLVAFVPQPVREVHRMLSRDMVRTRSLVPCVLEYRYGQHCRTLIHYNMCTHKSQYIHVNCAGKLLHPDKSTVLQKATTHVKQYKGRTD